MEVLTRRTHCRLCDCSSLDLALPIRPSPVGDAFVPQEKLGVPQPLFPLDLYLCQDCGHVQSLDIVNPEVLFSSYTYRTSSSTTLDEHFRGYAQTVYERFEHGRGGLAVEIGSNDGTLLSHLQGKGYKVQGVDPARDIANEATKAGRPTIVGFFSPAVADSIKKDVGAADLICANNVFAHIDDLAAVVEGIARLLKPTGVFVFECSYLVDIIDNMLFDTVYHEHLCYHSIRPLQRFFRRFGLHLFDVELITTKGGSLRGFVQQEQGPYPQAPIISELLGLESRRGIHRLPTYRQYSQKIEAVKSKLHQELDRIVASGKKIFGFGASITATTLIYHFQLEKYLSAIFDDNAAKDGLYSPGLHLPVCHSAQLYEREPGCVIILSWQYAQPILKRHQRYIDEGGLFLLPLPQPFVVASDTSMQNFNGVCAVCEGTLANRLDFGLQPASNDFLAAGEWHQQFNPLTVVSCQRCGLVQLTDLFPSQKLHPRYSWIVYREPEDHLEDMAEKIVELLGGNKDSLIAGLTPCDDSLLCKLQTRGYRTYRPMLEDFGLPDRPTGMDTLHGSITLSSCEKIAHKLGAADCLIVRDLLEHSHTPQELAKALRTLVREDGIIVFEVRDNRKILDLGLYYYLWEEHAAYYTASSLRQSLQFLFQCDSQTMVYDYSTDDTLVGWVRLGNSRQAQAIVFDDDHQLFENFLRRRDQRVAQVKNLLSGHRNSGRKVAVFGASHLMVKFINLYGLQNLIDFVIDDVPEKKGLRVPGSGLPIVGSECLNSGQVGLCLSGLSPKSEAAVRERHQQVFQNGCEFRSIFDL